MTAPLLELGGQPDAPPLHIACANGFVPATYEPFYRHFTANYRLICAPPRALWSDRLPPPPVSSAGWMDAMRDMVAALDAHAIHRSIAIGHSLGGIVSLLAAIEQPERFKALILLDPTILTPDIYAMLRKAQSAGMADQHPLAQGARRRRRDFDSYADAFDYFKGKPLFEDWHPDALQQYVHAGLIATDNGYTLAWSPEWEAYYFSTGYTQTWDVLPRLSPDIPTLIIRGSQSDTFEASSAEKVRDLLPSATHITLDGHGHLFPHSAPDQTAEIVGDWLKQLNS